MGLLAHPRVVGALDVAADVKTLAASPSHRRPGLAGRAVQGHLGDAISVAREGSLVMTDEVSPYPVRADLAAAQAGAWDRLARPGTWLDGPTRIRIAAETRHAPGCAVRAVQGCAVALHDRGRA